MASQNSLKRPRPSDDSEIPLKAYPKFFIIESEMHEKKIGSLSPFVIEKSLESLIGSPKSVKKLRNQTLLVETKSRSQTENILKIKQIYDIDVTITEHRSLNSSKGIIKDHILKGVSNEDIVKNLTPQGVTQAKRFMYKKDGQFFETNTILLTFNNTVIPPNLKIFYRIINVELYIPNPLRCFNCQKFGHHEDNCKITKYSICENCGMGENDHLTANCPNQSKCVNCKKDHISKSNKCETWIKEKEIMKIKCSQNISYFEARKIQENKPDISYSKIVQSAINKPIMKNAYTQTEIITEIITEKSEAKNSSNDKTKTHLSSQSSSQSTSRKSRSTSVIKSNSSQSKTNQQKKPNKPNGPSNLKQNSDRPPKGSVDPIKQSNKFSSLEHEDMELVPDPPPNTKM